MQYLIEYPIPEWVAALFLLAIPAPILLTMFLVKSAFNGSFAKRAFRTVGVFFSVYVIYILLLGHTGKFETVFFPPKVLLFTTFPFAFFLFLYVAKTSWFAGFIMQVALERLVGVHIFRLIGCFFLLLAFYDALPGWFAIIAGVGDVVTAITSIWVSDLIRRGHPDFRKITWLWNTFGLADILFTAVSANVLTKLSIDSGTMGVDTLATFPYYFIPALAPPLIVFLHYATYLKLKKHARRFS
jgi:hypothetical protein